MIDPQTGMLLKRLALPQDQPITYLPGGGDHYFYSVIDPDGAWNCQRSRGRSPMAKLVSIVVGSGSATVNTLTAHQLADRQYRHNLGFDGQCQRWQRPVPGHQRLEQYHFPNRAGGPARIYYAWKRHARGHGERRECRRWYVGVLQRDPVQRTVFAG